MTDARRTLPSRRRIVVGLAVLPFLLAVTVASGAQAPKLTTRFVSEQASSPHPPDSLLAVGASDLVDGSNAGLWLYTKTGTLLKQESWPQFWRRAGVPSSDLPAKCCVDPRAVWDRSLQRFWITTMAGTCGSCRDRATGRRVTSYVFLALSDTSKAAGSWHSVELDETVNDKGTYEPAWCDYDQLGIDSEAVYVGCDMLPIGSGTAFGRVRVIAKDEISQVIADEQHPTKHKQRCVLPPCSFWDFEHATDSDGGPSSPIAPATMLDGGPTAEFLVSVAGRRSGNSLTIRQVTDAAACCDGNPATTPKVVTKFEPVAAYAASSAVPQKGSTGRLDIGGVNLHSVIVYKSELYGAQTVSCSGSLSCIRVYSFAVGGWPTVTGTSQTLDSGGAYDYYPALGIARSGALTLVYGQSSSTEYPQVDFVGIPPLARAHHCPCWSGPPTLLQAGTSAYTHTSVHHGARTLGDYFAASTDPDFQHVWIHGNLGPSKTGTDWTSVDAETKPKP